MNFSDAMQSIIKPHEDDILTPLATVWGENLDSSCILPEYPRPQLVRNSYINLNGYWDYAFTPDASFPNHFDGKILVPFSPESALSGVNRQLKPGECLWYRTTLPVSKDSFDEPMRLFLHFGAVDYQTFVYVNGHQVCSHLGGYLPFHADITDFLKKDGNELMIMVSDPTDQGAQARGKQSLHRGGIFYTAQSGIWQSVWMEWVPANHIRNLWFETDYDKRMVSAHLSVSSKEQLPLSLSVSFEDQEILKASIPVNNCEMTYTFSIPENHFHSWSPETPCLYRVKLTLGSDDIESYFAMRLYSIEQSPDGKFPVFCLNHKPYFLMGVLDQGYWSDGLYTAPSDDALIYDITTMKSFGFNMMRKHIKIESARWYYHCDRLGMIVCQDMINGGGEYHMPIINYLPTLFPSLSKHVKDSHYYLFSRTDVSARKQWERECLEMIEYLKFFPSIAIWVPFNEGWGQFDAVRITDRIKKADPSRLVDSASGWFDQRCGDFISIHNYFRPLSVPVKKWGNRAFFLSEYGGFACHIKGHSSIDRVFGYKRYDTTEDFANAYRELIEKSLLPLRAKGLSGAVFTQLSDVEEEVNGILTYDRKINKLFPHHSL